MAKVARRSRREKELARKKARPRAVPRSLGEWVKQAPGRPVTRGELFNLFPYLMEYEAVRRAAQASIEPAKIGPFEEGRNCPDCPDCADGCIHDEDARTAEAMGAEPKKTRRAYDAEGRLVEVEA